MNDADPEPGQRWSTPLPAVVSAWMGAAGAAAWCVVVPDDPAGRLLLGTTAVLLAVAAGYASRVRPRLAVVPGGLRISGFTGSAVHPWIRVHRLEVLHTRRLGRTVHTLEIETDGRLHVFSRLELGADPEEVAARLRHLRATAR